MALINCPSCKQRVSDKAKICSSCNFNLKSGETSDGISQEQLESNEKLVRMKKRNSLQMQAMAGIILFLLGITLWYLLGESKLTKISHFIELGTAVVGGLWYLLTRIRLNVFKKL